MKFRIKSWGQVFAASAAITAMTVAIPLGVVGAILMPVPWIFKPPIFAIAGLIPLFITAPISVFALYILKTLHQTLDTLDQLVKFDPLTGLLARAHFLHLAEQQRKAGGYLALVDADQFKRVNDTFGHEAGDEALKHIASTMMQVIGKHGFVGRMGGEEFAIRMPQLSRPQAELLMATLGTRLRGYGVKHGRNYLKPTVSIGGVEDDGQQTLQELLHGADICLYKAKAAGRDRHVFEMLDERRALTA